MAASEHTSESTSERTGAHALTGSGTGTAGAGATAVGTSAGATAVGTAATTATAVAPTAVAHTAVAHTAVARTSPSHTSVSPGSVNPGAVTARRGGADVVPAVHRHEQPGDWGWHHDFGKQARIAGWASVLVLLLMITATQYNLAGTSALLIFAALLTAGLLIDARRRHTAWRR